jgi:hypothetical protein
MKYLCDMLKFKNPWESAQLMNLHPALAMVAIDMAFYFGCHGHEFVITSAIRSYEENKAVGAKSTTHLYEDGARAIDVRTGTIPEAFLKNSIHYFENKYSKVAAIVEEDGKYVPSLIVYGDRYHLDHMHIQVKRGLPTIYPLGGK